MKIRMDFVTNSSSSSFVCFTIQNAKLAEIIKKYGVDLAVSGDVIYSAPKGYKSEKWLEIGSEGYVEETISRDNISDWMVSFLSLMGDVYYGGFSSLSSDNVSKAIAEIKNNSNEIDLESTQFSIKNCEASSDGGDSCFEVCNLIDGNFARKSYWDDDYREIADDDDRPLWMVIQQDGPGELEEIFGCDEVKFNTTNPKSASPKKEKPIEDDRFDSIYDIDFVGKLFCFTGFEARGRDLIGLNKFVDAMISFGGDVRSDVSGKVDYLVIDNYFGGKYNKAKELQKNGGKIKIISRAMFEDIVRNKIKEKQENGSSSKTKRKQNQNEKTLSDKGKSSETDNPILFYVLNNSEKAFALSFAADVFARICDELEINYDIANSWLFKEDSLKLFGLSKENIEAIVAPEITRDMIQFCAGNLLKKCDNDLLFKSCNKTIALAPGSVQDQLAASYEEFLLEIYNIQYKSKYVKKKIEDDGFGINSTNFTIGILGAMLLLRAQPEEVYSQEELEAIDQMRLDIGFIERLGMEAFNYCVFEAGSNIEDRLDYFLNAFTLFADRGPYEKLVKIIEEYPSENKEEKSLLTDIAIAVSAANGFDFKISGISNTKLKEKIQKLGSIIELFKGVLGQAEDEFDEEYGDAELQTAPKKVSAEDKAEAERLAKTAYALYINKESYHHLVVQALEYDPYNPRAVYLDGMHYDSNATILEKAITIRKNSVEKFCEMIEFFDTFEEFEKMHFEIECIIGFMSGFSNSVLGQKESYYIANGKYDVFENIIKTLGESLLMLGDAIDSKRTTAKLTELGFLAWANGIALCYNVLNEYKNGRADAYLTKIRQREPSFDPVAYGNKAFDKMMPQTAAQSGGCYIATCVYGSYDCPEVWTLRRFRDNRLATNCMGRAFIKIYYAVSPKLVKWFGNTKWFKAFGRNYLDKMVKALQEKGFKGTPYND